jgi:hypothetical protein
MVAWSEVKQDIMVVGRDCSLRGVREAEKITERGWGQAVPFKGMPPVTSFL